MNREILAASGRAIRNKRIYDWVREFVKNGGYANPLDLFNTMPSDLPPKLSRYFGDPHNEIGILYSRDGALALMEEVFRPFQN